LSPPLRSEVSNTSTRDDHAFIEQQGPLGKQIAAVATQLAARSDDSVAGD